MLFMELESYMEEGLSCGIMIIMEESLSSCVEVIDCKHSRVPRVSQRERMRGRDSERR